MKKIILSVFVLMYVFSAIPVDAVMVCFSGDPTCWADDMSLSKTLGDDADGFMTWDEAMIWAENLDYGGWTDWRLPTTNDLRYDYNITDSELGQLFYNDLGGTAGEPLFTTTTLWQQYFINPLDAYWFSTKDSNGNPYFFDFRDGWQGGSPIPSMAFGVWAVHDGPVVVPEPASLLLIGSGLVGLIGRKRKWREKP